MSTAVHKNLIFIWLAAMSLLIGYVAWVQAATERKISHFDEIDVQRINIREPDGTLRMVISNTNAAPGTSWRGKEIPRLDRETAGIIFMNDEGTEDGGLIFGGGKEDGKISHSGHLSFDQYEQDQVISLDQGEENGERHATLTFNDMPHTPIAWDLFAKRNTPEGKIEIEKLAKSGGFGVQRVVIGKTQQRDSIVALKDARGRPRLVMKVAPDGAATVEFLDENGKTVRTLTPSG